MVNGSRNLPKVSMALLLTVLMALPVSGLDWSEDVVTEVEEGISGSVGEDDMTKTINSLDDRVGDNGLIELNNREIDELRSYFGGPPARSEPWSLWERYSYHRGGEEGLVAYQDSENRLFIYGGGSASWSNQQNYWSYNGYDDLFIYDFDDDKWYAIERYTSPGGRFGFSYVVDEKNERFIIYGGFAGSMLDDLWEFDMNTLQWTQLTSSVFGSYYGRRGYAPMVLDTSGTEEILYIHMGQKDDQFSYYGENMTGFFKIDLENPTATPTQINDGWNSGQGTLRPRFQHSMTIDESGRKIYIYGGIHMDGNGYVYLDDFWQYDIISGTWSQLTRDPTMPLNFGAKIFFRPTDDKVYLWGGRETESGEDENVTLWMYDVTIGSWDSYHYNNAGTDVPQGRLLYHHHYSTKADKFFVFGGRYYYRYGGYTRSSRYRDISYLTLNNRAWTLIPNLNNPSTTTGGIFAYEASQNRLHYIGPSTSYGTAYTWFWDLDEEKWYGPNYNTGSENPQGRSNAGMCYDEENNTVYMYGGGYTTGQGSNRRYYTLADMWKIDLSTYEWEKIWDTANPGPRQDFDMVWNDINGRIYFFGGREYPEPTSSGSVANDDFFSYIPGSGGGVFQPVLTSGKPGIRYGAGAVFTRELNKMYITCGRDPNPEKVKDYRDLWEYDFSHDKWTELDRLTSTMVSPKLDFDPLTRELYLTGGTDYVIKRYRILEDAWYIMDPDVNPGSMDGQAHIFIPETRDLWVYGGGIKPGIWKIGMPFRLSIQDIYFKDPESGLNNAYSMLRPYTFGTVVKAVNSPSDLSEVRISFMHRKGNFHVVYNSTDETFVELDQGDHAELVDTSVAWDGNYLRLEISILFHWNFSSKANDIDKRISVDVKGIDVSPDFLEIRRALDVKNSLEIVNEPEFNADIQGKISKGDWVRAEESIEMTGSFVRYVGTDDLFPPADTYGLTLYEGHHTQNIHNILLSEVYRTWEIDKVPGEPIDFTFNAPNRTYSNVTYILNMTGVNSEDINIYKEFWLSVDGIAPSKPTSILIHADSFDDSHTNFDDDLEVFLSWMGAGVSESGINTYYWSFEDHGGTRNGNPIQGTNVIVDLPSNGTHTLYVWAEDNVGNIGLSANASIHIDTDPPLFQLVKPDIDQLIPYQVLEMRFNITDPGGSRLNSITLKYRFSNDGQDSDQMWNDDTAWKDLPDLWTDFPKEFMEFDFTVGKDTPKMTDSDENFLQFKIKDYAGNEQTSEIYNIRVDTDLRFPMVTLFGPENGDIFDNVDDIELNWTLDFFLPEDVTYYLYIDEGEEGRTRVENHDLSIMIELTRMSYKPEFVDHGTWYWTVIPVAQNQWEGNSTNGIKHFIFTNEASFSFEVKPERDEMVRAQGSTGIPITFEITNNGQNDVVFNEITYDLKGIGTLSWSSDSFTIRVGETKAITASLDIFESTPVSNYTIVFYFNSTRSVNRVVEINMKIVEPVIENPADNDEEDNLAMYLIMGAISVILLLVIIALIYFTVIKKEKNKRVIGAEDDLDELEDELIGTGDGTSRAPIPTGITAPSNEKETKGSSEGTDEDEGAIPQAEEPTKLAEDGSDDDWMNLVAKETISAESQSEIEEDKTRHDEGKSLQDLLNDMSSGIENE